MTDLWLMEEAGAWLDEHPWCGHMSPHDNVRELHEKFGLTHSYSPQWPSREERTRRLKHLDEEFNELVIADRNLDLVEVADALGDIVSLCYGYALAHGIDLDAALAEISRSNMTKTAGEGARLVKGEGYERPQIAKALGWDSLDHLEVL